MNTKATELKANFVIDFGKYKGKEISYVCQHNPSYILWWNEIKTLPKLHNSVIKLATDWYIDKIPFISAYGHYSDGFE